MRLRMSPQANAGLRTLPPAAKKSMRNALRALAEDPSGRTADLDVVPLRFATQAAYHRLRVGSFRALIAVRQGEVLILEVFSRARGYRWLEKRYGGT